MINQGSTNNTLRAVAYNDDGTAKDDLAYDTTGISIYVQKIGVADGSPLSLEAKSGTTWAAGAFKNLDNGDISVDVADAVFASYTGDIRIVGTFTGGYIVGVWEQVRVAPTEPATPTNVSDAETAILAKLPESGRANAVEPPSASAIALAVETELMADGSGQAFWAGLQTKVQELFDNSADVPVSVLVQLISSEVAASLNDPSEEDIATAVTTALGALISNAASSKAVTDKLDSAMEEEDAAWRFTTEALANSPASSGGGFGPGSVERSILVRDNSGNPLANAEVWIRATNSVSAPVIWSGTSNDTGLVKPWLDAGTYYFWLSKAGFNASNPYTVTIT